jgi:hypothetical protein
LVESQQGKPIEEDGGKGRGNCSTKNPQIPKPTTYPENQTKIHPPTYPSPPTHIPPSPQTQAPPLHQTTPPFPTSLNKNQPSTQTNTPPQPYTAQYPPPTTGIPTASDEEGDVLNMEVEENPDFMTCPNENQTNQANLF